MAGRPVKQTNLFLGRLRPTIHLRVSGLSLMPYRFQKFTHANSVDPDKTLCIARLLLHSLLRWLPPVTRHKEME